MPCIEHACMQTKSYLRETSFEQDETWILNVNIIIIIVVTMQPPQYQFHVSLYMRTSVCLAVCIEFC